MKVLKSTLLEIIIIIGIFSSCVKLKNNCVDIPTANSANCIDSTLIDPTDFCTEVWAPVCGCNGVTYDNPCHATTYSGVTSYTNGECCE